MNQKYYYYYNRRPLNAVPQFLYEDDKYDKPFFCTYFKTSMFSIYLLIIGIVAPWKEACERQNGNYSVCILFIKKTSC